MVLLVGFDVLVQAFWIRQGASPIGEGLVGYTSDGRVGVAGARIDVADTVGAGDTVGAIVVEAMIEEGLFNLRAEKLENMLIRAAVAAGITCSRKGAQPPYKYELKQAMGK